MCVSPPVLQHTVPLQKASVTKWTVIMCMVSVCTKTIDFEVDRESHLPSTRSTDLDDDGQSVRHAQYAFASRKVFNMTRQRK